MLLAEIQGQEFVDILKMIAPGTQIREGLENILKAKTGGLIVIGDSQEVLGIVDGGFKLGIDYSPARLYELAKMDGAIVLSADLKKILFANTQLIPSSTISTTETGTRHRTAERTAKQTGELVVSISQKKCNYVVQGRLALCFRRKRKGNFKSKSSLANGREI